MISIKPHHFVDIITALGEGCTSPEPHPYGHAVHTVTKAILENRDVKLRMDFGADDICRPCCHNIGGLCDDTIDISFRPRAPRSKREYNLLMDQRWSERLGIHQGDMLTARELCSLIRDRSGNINGIYLEMPADMNAERLINLEKGTTEFLK